MKNINETKVPQSFTTGLYTERNYDVAIDQTSTILDILIHGVTECLGSTKSKEAPVAFFFAERNGDFIGGAVVQFIDNEDGDDGNWQYFWTFEEGDIPENAKKFSVYDSQLASFFRGFSMNKYGMGFDNIDYIADIFIYLLSIIKLQLEHTAVEEDNGFEVPKLVQFRSAVENNNVVYSIEVDPEIKQIIKTDASTTKSE